MLLSPEEVEEVEDDDLNLQVLGQMEILLEGLTGPARREAATQIYRDAEGVLRRRQLRAL